MAGMPPAERIRAYFAACTSGSAADIAAHFTEDAVIYDTNVRPVRGAAAIGPFWVGVRERWQGAAWAVESVVAEGEAAAIEWAMTGTSPAGRPFVVRGSEHYRFAPPPDGRISEIRQYWTFDRDHLDTSLVGFPYPADR
jgi:ketosteroid isomerase-like protein